MVLKVGSQDYLGGFWCHFRLVYIFALSSYPTLELLQTCSHCWEPAFVSDWGRGGWIVLPIADNLSEWFEFVSGWITTEEILYACTSELHRGSLYQTCNHYQDYDYNFIKTVLFCFALFVQRRLRWHSFQIAHQLSHAIGSLQISSQSAAQLNLLQKFSLLRLTAIMEKYSMSNKHGWTW